MLFVLTLWLFKYLFMRGLINIVFAALTTMFCLGSSSVSAQAWDYPVKPGQKEWEQFTTHSEMVQACQIPNDVLKLISTQDLLKLCLNYPLQFDFYAYNTVDEGLRAVLSQFNGLQELISRPNCFEVLVNNYSTELHALPLRGENKDLGERIFKNTLVEAILLRKMDDGGVCKNSEAMKPLQQKIIVTSTAKLANKGVYSEMSVDVSTKLLKRFIEHTQDELLQNERVSVVRSNQQNSIDGLRLSELVEILKHIEL